MSGDRPIHEELEKELAQWKSADAALVFPTGYSANLGVLSALAGAGVLICSDALNHASIIDGCRLAASLGARVETYAHADLAAVSALLRDWPGRSAVVTDAVFSMDGDLAPVPELADLCGRHGGLLVLDEAHAVLGPHWRELPCEVLHIGTLSKALGSQGGFAAATKEIVDLLVNRCRPFIYTTGLAPPSAAAALAALRILRSPEGSELRARLQGHSRRLRPEQPPISPIVPFVTGSESAALEASAALLDMGLFVPAVRPPTVPPGTSRLRVTLSSAHTEEEVDLLVEALQGLGFS